MLRRSGWRKKGEMKADNNWIEWEMSWVQLALYTVYTYLEVFPPKVWANPNPQLPYAKTKTSDK
jgi:hypothetical protein